MRRVQHDLLAAQTSLFPQAFTDGLCDDRGKANQISRDEHPAIAGRIFNHERFGKKVVFDFIKRAA